MGYNTHDLGDLVRVSAEYRNPTTHALLDPSVVKLSVRNTEGLTTYTYGTDAIVVKDAVGQYHADLDADVSGDWHYRWWSTGTGQAADEQMFKVRTARAV